MLLIVALLFVLNVDTTLAQTAPATGFAGTWLLDAKQSVFAAGSSRPDKQELVVTASGNQLNVNESRTGENQVYTIRLDGVATTHDWRGGRYTLVARREGDGVAVNTSMTRLADQEGVKYTQRWSLSQQGRTLTVHTAYPRGIDVILIYTRKQGGS